MSNTCLGRFCTCSCFLGDINGPSLRSVCSCRFAVKPLFRSARKESLLRKRNDTTELSRFAYRTVFRRKMATSPHLRNQMKRKTNALLIFHGQKYYLWAMLPASNTGIRKMKSFTGRSHQIFEPQCVSFKSRHHILHLYSLNTHLIDVFLTP